MSATVIPSSTLDKEIAKTNKWFETVGIKEAKLDGEKLDAALGEAILRAEAVRTISGSPSLEISVFDKDKDLLQNFLPKERGAILEFNDRSFTLERTDKRSKVELDLTFEPETVTWLRSYNKVRKATRGKMTRAEFIYSLMREVKEGRMLFFCPELHKRQKVGAVSESKRGGIAKDAKLKVKTQKMSDEQRRTCNAVLDACIALRMPRIAMVAAIMCIIQENNATNRPGGDPPRDSTGAFQQRASTGWKGIPADASKRADIGVQVKNFWSAAPTTPFKTSLRKKKVSLGWQIDQTQRSHTFGTSRQGKEYDQWRKQADAIVAAYGGKAGSIKSAKYEFTRGTSGSKETTWDAANRLAEEVNWIFYVDGRVVFLIDKYELMHYEPVATITEEDGFEILWSVDSGGKVDELTVTAVNPDWSLFPGCIIDVDGEGVADGRWLVKEMRKPLLTDKQTVTVTCLRPSRPAAEPAETGSKKASSSEDLKAPAKIAELHKIAQIISRNTPGYLLGGGHGAPIGSVRTTQKLDCSSSSSLALYRAGMFDFSTPIVSGKFASSWGKPGRGEWLTVWANAGHVFILYKYDGKMWRLDTGNPGGGRGPKLHEGTRSTAGFTPRHYPGL